MTETNAFTSTSTILNTTSSRSTTKTTTESDTIKTTKLLTATTLSTNLPKINVSQTDTEICAPAEEGPTRYLKRNLDNCDKFYSCQKLGKGRWKAHLMDCPLTTWFDDDLTNLKQKFFTFTN